MPELPEVETVRRELVPWLTGRRITRARRADAPAGPKYRNLERADGQRIEAVGRRGKFLLLPLSGGDELIIHLGMTGIVTPKKPNQHLRVVVHLSGRKQRRLYFQDPRRFGRFLVVPTGDYRTLPTLHHLGPEPLGQAFTNAGFYRALQRSRTPIKVYIMGQRPVAGVGNIYADESLWRARIHPLTPARRLSRTKVAALRQAIIDILTASIAAQGTTLNDYRTVNGEVGAYLAELNAYGHAGCPCARCSTILKRIVVGQRGTSFCPRCQRQPRPRKQ
ncbi:MAG TPA: bifunctional DNA-formamidopyrimidine glycosylase/DNA-(apurinic or apyrimidinic site) lyase [Sorangium sp.]|nr:bifunctional DNA-formamidopyrimidine glycosylase/DNA-(apurinic or apyrimidinic site) lyase [Sorangium sp.]